MGDHDVQPTCLSSEIHDAEIRDYFLHYTGCIEISEREYFFSDSNPLWADEINYETSRLQALGNDEHKSRATAKARIDRQVKKWRTSCEEQIRRIDYLRKVMKEDPAEAALVVNLNRSYSNWRNESYREERLKIISNWRASIKEELNKQREQYRKQHGPIGGQLADAHSKNNFTLRDPASDDELKPDKGANDPCHPTIHSLPPVYITRPDDRPLSRQKKRDEEDYTPEKDINVYELGYKYEASPSNLEDDCRDQLSGQKSVKTPYSRKHKVEDVLRLQGTSWSRPLLKPQDPSPGLVRYFHLPANNMMWVESAIAQYYGEKRPDYGGIYRDVRPVDMNKTYMILRPQYWRGQQHGGRRALPHARHMRPMCERISSEPSKVDTSSDNIVLFMPYLHWETDRQRDRFAKEMEAITGEYKSKQAQEAAETKLERQKLRKALLEPNLPPSQMQGIWSKSHEVKKTVNEYRSHPTPHQDHGMDSKVPQDSHTETRQPRPFEKLAIAMGFPPRLPADGRLRIRNKLGQYLIDAARLFEAMSAYRDRKLMRKYLTEDPPLHPRRTLDQAYYWNLNTTKTRDRDQVVYRETTARPEDFHEFDAKKMEWPDHQDMRLEPGEMCNDCRSNIRKLSRVVMVDQLWMWILDRQTILTSFPKRYGAIKNDASGVHKSIRLRLERGRQNQIRSAFDLALIIIDECSNTFFDRTKTPDRQPQVIDAFSDAIGKLTNRQTRAFELLWYWTERACRIYKSQGNPDTSDLHVGLLDIHPEGTLQRETKDILEELDIMIRINRTHYRVLKRFVNHVEHIMNPQGQLTRRRGAEASHTRRSMLHPTGAVASSVKEDTDLSSSCGEIPRNTGVTQDSVSETDRDSSILGSKYPSSLNSKKEGDDDVEKKEEYEWFCLNAEELLDEVQERIHELVDLRNSAQSTSDGLKDLLALKQQQAGVVQAWQAVKLSTETVKQGHSIMIFTIVTIIFLPLSFMSSVFGMNAAEFGQGNVKIIYELSLIIPISIIIITITFIFAFSTWIRAAIWYGYRIFTTHGLLRFGFYERYLKQHTPIRTNASEWLIIDAMEKTEKLRNKIREKVVTERWEGRMQAVHMDREAMDDVALSQSALQNGKDSNGMESTDLRKRRSSFTGDQENKGYLNSNGRTIRDIV